MANMPQSFHLCYHHLVFSTKNRQRHLDSAIREKVHAYLAGFLRNHDCEEVLVGGPDDHVHILFRSPKSGIAATTIGQLKSETSKHVHTLGGDYRDFAWQRGYGMFSVSPTHIGDVRNYILGQEEHHRQTTFQDEFRGFLHRYGIEYDERYVWD
jgi:REP element-mobilizing transposase RayT